MKSRVTLRVASISERLHIEMNEGRSKKRSEVIIGVQN